MDNFWVEIVKIVVDKALLGGVALWVGFQLARKLEDYKTRRSQDLFIANRQTEAIVKLVDLITRDHRRFVAAVQIMRRPADAWSDEDHALVSKYSAQHESFSDATLALVPLFPETLMDKVNGYLRLLNSAFDSAEEPSAATLGQAYTDLLNDCRIALTRLTP